MAASRTEFPHEVTDSGQNLSATSCVFLFHTGSNVGYSIEPAEKLFCKVGLELAGGDASRVRNSKSEIPVEFLQAFV
jgi:hypothetical protein